MADELTLPLPPVEEFPDGSPSRETRDMHPQDLWLRRHGYRIEHRPPGGEPIWSLARVLYTQSQALELTGYEAPDV